MMVSQNNKKVVSMNEVDERLVYVNRLQGNLSTIRKMAGWSAEALGQKIGLSKQSISKLETGKSLMTIAQYIAIRTMFDFEIQNNPETGPVLAQVLKMLIDDPALPDDQDDSNEDNTSSVGTTAIPASPLAGSTASTIAGAAAILGSMWMSGIFKK
ncbi:MAG: XRE family transcriptional regulator [Firmicutes bacterium HGW-Firmicutes-4]|jgi:DNA-binding XRE family transcriptional regulator|nr:MAG: XRE family transcriptional regulator [Firmicutes bacterium HGW-Firmicutes-4]